MAPCRLRRSPQNPCDGRPSRTESVSPCVQSVENRCNVRNATPDSCCPKASEGAKARRIGCSKTFDHSLRWPMEFDQLWPRDALNANASMHTLLCGLHRRRQGMFATNHPKPTMLRAWVVEDTSPREAVGHEPPAPLWAPALRGRRSRGRSERCALAFAAAAGTRTENVAGLRRRRRHIAKFVAVLVGSPGQQWLRAATWAM